MVPFLVMKTADKADTRSTCIGKRQSRQRIRKSLLILVVCGLVGTRFVTDVPTEKLARWTKAPHQDQDSSTSTGERAHRPRYGYLEPERFSCAVSPTRPPVEETVPRKLVSVLVPVYMGASKTGNILGAIGNQTYRPLEIIVSLDVSPDADQTQAVVEQFMQSNPNLRLHRQRDRLHWVNNVNFLLSQSTGDYVTIIPHDDWIPPDYVEKLANCLDEDPQAVNCYPYLNVVQTEAMRQFEKLPKKFFQDSIEGPQHERVDQAITHCCAWSMRGLVRRPSHGSMLPFHLPRLHKNYFGADIVQILYHATAGNVKQADVGYDKLYHLGSVHNAMRLNRTVFPQKDREQSLLHLHTKLYNDAHSYASSSRKTYDAILQRYMKEASGISPDRKSDDDAERAKLRRVLDRQIRRTRRVAILGAGIQGCVMALMFRKNGYDVTIYDKSDDIMNRASMAGEGKIHFGLVYNKDPTMKTGEHMMRSALRFSSYIDYLVGAAVDWDALKSERFTYLLPYTSLITPQDFEDYAAKLEDIYETVLLEEPGLSYLGLRPPNLIERRAELHPRLNASFFEAEYTSAEYSVSPKNLRAVLKKALLEQSVKTVFGRRVVEARRNGDDHLGRWRVATDVSEHDFDAVVNCLWEGRASIDRKLGIRFSSVINYRFKIGIKFPFMDEYADLPSVTVVNGAFGDFVRYTPDTGMYFSYYPVSRLGMTVNETEMMEWDDLADGNVPEDLSKYQLEAHQQAFDMFFPGNKKLQFKCPRVGGGYILGNGATDILDEKSGLHERSDYPFVMHDGYISVSTQKLTSAPYNAYLLEQMLFRKSLNETSSV